MPHVRFTRNFYDAGELKFAAGAVYDVEEAALHVHRGEAELLADPPVAEGAEVAATADEPTKPKRRR